MDYKHIQNIDKTKDLIVPVKKNDSKSLKKYTSVKDVNFNGDFGSISTLYGAKGNKIYLLGIGEDKDNVKLVEAFRKLCFETKKYWSKSIQLVGEELSEDDIRKAVTGLELGTYDIGQFKSKKEKATKFTVEVSSSKNIISQLQEGKLTGETVNRIKALVDAPANHKTPEFLGNWAKESSKASNYKCTVLHQDELKKQGFDAVMAVGQGSANPPVVIINEYMPKKGKKVDIGLVGKGITFDTGGLSIKSSTNLHYMKSDMGGAAVVLGVVELVAKLKLNVNIVGVVCSAENAVDSNSYRPGDVINSYSGKTIEIIDTDAEGRLVLADGLNYIIKKFKPEQVIDLATLTGSVVQTLGYFAAGMFSNNTEMSNQMSKVGYETNERVWPLPLFEDYESDLHSDVADLRNFSGKPIAGAITAAKFLEAFTEEHKSWMHLDIAGVSFGDSPYAKMKSASGYGVQLITNYIKTKVAE
ncbi:leucyl aminopeptidase family protein [Subsaxibacter sp. CAU 1640]|uniref:leucyl aminopeptidase family protein n=1 Tax=Subsaxibacter sp. CAU 1640 TaxID=2933271 RepID=UPI0020040802|nr:leucyl aminopeptidase family protein [Subsaxibacter sp. CAU 1640]MCK7591635.1 leucyl aminopeptidase family protein [Subsaxibacter sp. CAU 1640]